LKSKDNLFLSLKKNDFIIKKEEEKMKTYTLSYDETDRKKSKILSLEKLFKKLIHKKTDIQTRFEKFYFIRWKIFSVSNQINSLFEKLKNEYFNYINIPVSNKKILNVALIEEIKTVKSDLVN
jgi:aspartokinase